MRRFVVTMMMPTLCGAAAVQEVAAQGIGSPAPIPTPAAPPVAPISTPAGPPVAAVSGVVVTARRPTHVEGVTVTAPDWCPTPDPVRHPADHDPQVIASFPAEGAAVAPGYGVVRVTFDAPMSCYSEVSVEGGGDDDPCEPSGTWELPDRRSWIMQCRWDAGARYKLTFRRMDGHGFVGLSGRAAGPYVLQFSTTSAAPTPSRAAAMLADPGAPKAGETRAYVTCTDAAASGPVQPCRHERFDRPPG